MTRRIQFSLGRLLVAMTLVTLVTSHVYTSWQLKQAREKIASMATELGYLTISDPNRLNVIALKTFDEMTWRWRVHVPAGRQYAVWSATSKIPFVGLPVGGGPETMLEPGEYIFTVAVRADGLGKWKLTIADPQTSIRTTIDEADAAWLVNCPGYAIEQAGASATEAADDDKPFVLVRLNVSSNRPAPNRCTDGILIWAVEEKAAGIAAAPLTPVGVAESDASVVDGVQPRDVQPRDDPRPIDSAEPTVSREPVE